MMRLHAFTIRWSYLAPVPVIYVGGVLENRVRDVLRLHGVAEAERSCTALGVRVVVVSNTRKSHAAAL